jgi:hypothetical protein
MAQSHLHQSVLPAKPQADTSAYLSGLLDELRAKIDALPIVPGQRVPVDTNKLVDLRGVFLELSGAVRNQIKWQAL